MNRAPELPGGTVPAGASHFYHNPEHPKPSTFAWRKRAEGKWYMFKADEWHPISGQNAHLFVPISQVLQAEWDGTGEPPVGTLVEFDKGGEWVTVSVFAVKERTGDPVDVLFDGPDGWGVIALGSPRLRPVRTAEQVYRERQIEALRDAIFTATRVCTGREEFEQLVAEMVFNAGFNPPRGATMNRGIDYLQGRPPCPPDVRRQHPRRTRRTGDRVEYRTHGAKPSATVRPGHAGSRGAGEAGVAGGGPVTQPTETDLPVAVRHLHRGSPCHMHHLRTLCRSWGGRCGRATAVWRDPERSTCKEVKQEGIKRGRFEE